MIHQRKACSGKDHESPPSRTGKQTGLIWSKHVRNCEEEQDPHGNPEPRDGSAVFRHHVENGYPTTGSDSPRQQGVEIHEKFRPCYEPLNVSLLAQISRASVREHLNCVNVLATTKLLSGLRAAL